MLHTRTVVLEAAKVLKSQSFSLRKFQMTRDCARTTQSGFVERPGAFCRKSCLGINRLRHFHALGSNRETGQGDRCGISVGCWGGGLELMRAFTLVAFQWPFARSCC